MYLCGYAHNLACMEHVAVNMVECQGVCIVVCVWIACQQSATVNFVEIAIIFISDIQQPRGISSC